MPAGKELKERKLEHWCALIRNPEVVKALVFNQNHQEEEDEVWPEAPVRLASILELHTYNMFIPIYLHYI